MTSTSLEESTANLEAAFQNAEERLESIGIKVDGVLLAGSSSAKQPQLVGGASSVTKVLKEFQSVKADFRGIVNSVSELQSRQGKLLEEVAASLKAAGNSADHLKWKVGCVE